jgi:hypothetical protein
LTVRLGKEIYIFVALLVGREKNKGTTKVAKITKEI